jgi:hypothetical protein
LFHFVFPFTEWGVYTKAIPCSCDIIICPQFVICTAALYLLVTHIYLGFTYQRAFWGFISVGWTRWRGLYREQTLFVDTSVDDLIINEYTWKLNQNLSLPR